MCYSEWVFVCLDKWVSSCLIKTKDMTQYEKMLFEVLINYIPKVSNSLEDIVEELKMMNLDNRLNDIINDK